MGAGVELVPKRKLIGLSDGGDIDAFISHILENRDNIVPQIQGSWTISGTTPTLRFIETDQTDPAGRWRFWSSSNRFELERPTGTDWSSSIDIMEVNVASEYTLLQGPLAPGGLGYVRLHGGTSANTLGAIYIGKEATLGVYVSTGDGAGSNTTRMSIGTGATSVDVTFASCNVYVPALYISLGALYSSGTSGLTVRANSAVAQATGYSIYLQALDTTADAFLDVLTIVPNGASPTINLNSRAITSGGSMTFAASSVLASGSTNGDTLLLKANDSTFITFTTGATDACTLASCTLSGTWLASGTVTFPAITFNAKITSTVAAGSPILKASATSNTPTATWGAAAGNEVSTAPSGWLEMQDGSDNARYIPFWA